MKYKNTKINWLICLALLVLTGCSSRIGPAKIDNFNTATHVYLLDHGWHSSLVLPHKNGGFMRYSYGDWEWYALANTGVISAFKALFIPSKAGLGRKYNTDALDLNSIQKNAVVESEYIHKLKVPWQSVINLYTDLDLIYSNGQSELLYRYEYDLEFVPHPENYTMYNNSNQMVSQWLKQLGLEVKPQLVVFSNWRTANTAD